MHLKIVSALILLKAACCTSSSRNEHRNDISETLWHLLHCSTTANQLQQFSSNVYKRSSSFLAGGCTPYPISYLCVVLFISQQNKRNYQKTLIQKGKSIIHSIPKKNEFAFCIVKLKKTEWVALQWAIEYDIDARARKQRTLLSLEK